MKHWLIILILVAELFLLSWTFRDDSKDVPVQIPVYKQRAGDSASGYNYLVTGDYLKSGIPLTFYRLGYKKDSQDLHRTGLNKNVTYSFTVVTAFNGESVVAPNCLQCHAQVFDDKVIVGLGNTFTDFTDNRSAMVRFAEKALKSNQENQNKYLAAKSFIDAIKAVSAQLTVPTKGVNVADRLAALLIAHRDPASFLWMDSAVLKVPSNVVPTDVPAWWLLKKKHAMFYNGFGRGDFGRFFRRFVLRQTHCGGFRGFGGATMCGQHDAEFGTHEFFGLGDEAVNLHHDQSRRAVSGSLRLVVLGNRAIGVSPRLALRLRELGQVAVRFQHGAHVGPLLIAFRWRVFVTRGWRHGHMVNLTVRCVRRVCV